MKITRALTEQIIEHPLTPEQKKLMDLSFRAPSFEDRQKASRQLEDLEVSRQLEELPQQETAALNDDLPNRETQKEKLQGRRLEDNSPGLTEKLQELFTAHLETAKEDNWWEDQDEEQRFDIEAKAISAFYNKLADFSKYLETNYKDHLWKKNDPYPRGWMLKDKKIRILMDRYRIVDVMNEIERHLTPLQERRREHKLI